jgi:hypothetical protein
MRTLALRLSTALTAVLAAGTASAHEGHTEHDTASGPFGGADPLALGLLLSGILVFGAGLYLNSREDVGRIYALTGVGIGLAGLAAALWLYLRQGV